MDVLHPETKRLLRHREVRDAVRRLQRQMDSGEREPEPVTLETPDGTVTVARVIPCR